MVSTSPQPRIIKQHADYATYPEGSSGLVVTLRDEYPQKFLDTLGYRSYCFTCSPILAAVYFSVGLILNLRSQALVSDDVNAWTVGQVLIFDLTARIRTKIGILDEPCHTTGTQ
jgi:hypothetical protein